MDWQPMSTAPKDRTVVLLIFEDGEVYSACHDGHAPDHHNGWWTDGDNLDFNYGQYDPIGWLPRSALPPKPDSE